MGSPSQFSPEAWDDMRAKFEAFIGYGRQGRFSKLIEFYARKYHLDIPDPDDVLVRYRGKRRKVAVLRQLG